MIRTSVIPLVLIAILATGSAAETIVVDHAGGGDFETIVEAVEAAQSGDIILVAPGLYTGALNRDIDFGDKNLTLRSMDGAAATVIDCAGAGRGVYLHGGQDATSSVEGFTIRNGYGTRGGGIHLEGASPKLRQLIFEGNHATEAGGGLYCVDAHPTLEGIVFEDNYGGETGYGHGGGGMQCNASSPTLEAVSFIGNSATSGGGLYCIDGSCPILSDCTFADNDAIAVQGGALFCYGGSCPELYDCQMFRNEAERKGGAVFCDNSSPILERCTIAENRSFFTGSGFGGGALFANNLAQPVLRNVTVVENRANYGAGVFVATGAAPVLENVIIAFNVEGDAVHCDGSRSGPLLTCCDVFGNEGGDWVGCIAGQAGIYGNISADPLFCGEEAPSQPYSLYLDSPCSPTGNPECGLIGAWDVACGWVSVQATSWGVVKSMYR
jgi:predicted outer membrane repeat protein